jgi:hypothetical protein
MQVVATIVVPAGGLWTFIVGSLRSTLGKEVATTCSVKKKYSSRFLVSLNSVSI